MPDPDQLAPSSVAHQKDVHRKEVSELLADLGSRPEGLTSEEAKARLSRFGPNELRARQKTPEIIKFLRQLKNFFALLLIAGGCLALLAEHLDPGQGNIYIASALFGVTLLNALFTYLQEHQSEKIMESFKKMLPTMVIVLRDGKPQRINAHDLVPGDVIQLFEGDRVPADGRLIKDARLKVDLASLTGESEPQPLDHTVSAETLLESRNMVFSGTLVQSGDGTAVITQTGMDTQIGKIVELTKETGEVETPIHRELRYFIKVISAIAIFLGFLFFAISVVIGKGELGSLIFAIGIIVANVPEGLLPTVTLALTMASKRMAKKNALIKNLESVETLGSTTVICTDKTGTLTQNRLAVVSLSYDEKELRADSLGASDLGHSETLQALWRIMALCNNAVLTKAGYSGDPTEGALLLFAERLRDSAALRAQLRSAEQPFDYAAKRMATLYPAEGGGYQAYLKGAPEVVLDLCDHILLDGAKLPLTPQRRQAVIQSYRRMAERGERGLGFAFAATPDQVIPDQRYCFAGIAGMIDPPRPEVPDAMATCHDAGIRVVMITGDYGLTASSIAYAAARSGASWSAMPCARHKMLASVSS